MKFWTFQRKEIISHLLQNGEYKPDFNATPQHYALARTKAYNHILKDYNRTAKAITTGLVFGYTYVSIDDLYKAIEAAGYLSGSYYSSTTHLLLELEIPSSIYIQDIEYLDFSDLIAAYGGNAELDKVCKVLYTQSYVKGWDLRQSTISHLEWKWLVDIHSPREVDVC